MFLINLINQYIYNILNQLFLKKYYKLKNKSKIYKIKTRQVYGLDLRITKTTKNYPNKKKSKPT